MDRLLNVRPKLFWYNYSSVWWCIKSNIFRLPDDICQRFTKRLVWYIIFHNYQYELNRTASMVIKISPYQPLIEAMLSSPVVCRNILHIFWGGIKPPNLCKIN